MDKYKYLILKYYEKTNETNDITEDVEFIRDKKTYYEVKYKNKDKEYCDKKKNIAIYRDPVSLNIQGKALFNKDVPLTDVVVALRFGNKAKVFYSDGTSKLYDYNSLNCKDSYVLGKGAKSFYDYLLEIAKVLKCDDEKEILYSQLENLSFFKESVLYKFTKGEIGKNKIDINSIIYPFGCNKSQKEAVQNALQYNMSIIQGPPGTGKTQTILNIIANLVSKNKKVAIVSGNNEAIYNIQEKLKSKHLDCFSAFLGKDDNVRKFFNEMHDIDFECKRWANNKYRVDIICQKIMELNDNLINCDEYKIRVAELKHLIHEVEIEKSINDAEFNIKTEESSLNKVHFTLERLLKLKAELSTLDVTKQKNFWTRLKFLFKFGIFKVNKYFDDITSTLEFLDNKYYELKLKELNKELRNKQEFLNRNKSDDLMAKLLQSSEYYLQSQICKHYLNQTFDLAITNYKYHFNKFTSRFPIVFSTTHSIRKTSGINYLYDYLIIDESSQVDIVSAIISMACSKNIVLVGDLKQLPPVVKSDIAKISQELFKQYDLPSYWEYSKNSILDVFSQKYKGIIPDTLLNEHYRCDPEIIEFCNKRFYNNKLIVQTEHHSGNGVKVIYSESHHARGRRNERQVDIIEKEILPQLKNVNKNEIGIIAPFNDQINMLNSRLSDCCGKISSIHKFQGKEKEIIILSTVVNKIKIYEDPEHIDFLNSPNLLNVAISRAKSKLYMVISEELMKQSGAILSDFARYIKYFCSETTIQKTSIYSVLDLQYKDFSPYLLPLKKRLLNRSIWACENIIDTIISDICLEQKYGVLSYVRNYPLRKIVKVENVLREEDKIFIMRPGTHCDFVIYNDLDKSVLMTVEVDGNQHNEEIQKQRDEKKDRILFDAKIPTLRLNTTASECKEKIETILEQITNIAN